MIIEGIQYYPHVSFGSKSFGSKANLIRNRKYLKVAGVDTILTSKFSMKTIMEYNWKTIQIYVGN